jgi:peptidoglycan/xylan/chitin deacetylase (PgdA/CDA1 family)
MDKPIPFVWTNADVSNGSYDKLARVLDWLARFDLKGTFFVVPRLHGEQQLTDDPKLVELLKSAMAAGHEAHQHSTTHHCEENGTADLRMYDLMGESAKAQYSRQRFVFERLWQLDALQAQIDWGRQVWIDAFGAPSPGYRPGCGAYCRNMYTALENLAFTWVSARLVSVTGWQWAFKHYAYPVTWEYPGLPSRVGAMVEVPILDDVAFNIPADKIDVMVELGWQHWRHCVENHWPFVLVSHPFALEYEGGTGYRIHEKLLPRIMGSGLALPMTMNQYHRRLQAGEFPMLAAGEGDPDSAQIPSWHVRSRAASANGKGH